MFKRSNGKENAPQAISCALWYVWLTCDSGEEHRDVYNAVSCRVSCEMLYI